ncbi:MAG: hypothetical protein AB9835_09120 [Eubacteriales bacterium]
MCNTADVFLKVNTKEKTISVKCVIKFSDEIKTFSFSLSTLMTVDSITSDTQIHWENTREWQPQWQHRSNEINITAVLPIKEICIVYHGGVAGWCNIIEENRIALSPYSAWTISETTTRIDYTFKIEGMEDYFILNARYDNSERLWIYGETEHESGNIIALKKGQYFLMNSGAMNYYYMNPDEKTYADMYAHYYEDIINFYNYTFAKKDIKNLNIVSLNIEKGGGAYFRKELIVIDKAHITQDISLIKKNTVSLLAHELGHNWFAGADTSSWEDWLNETGAEWAALLYILSQNDKALFDEKIGWLEENYRVYPIIKPEDIKRPVDGVHSRGVMLFYEIYKRYGCEVLLVILKELANLSQPTTEELLQILINKVDTNIIHIIRQGLKAQDYSVL